VCRFPAGQRRTRFFARPPRPTSTGLARAFTMAQLLAVSRRCCCPALLPSRRYHAAGLHPGQLDKR